jgi:hypothetical protein
MSANPINEQPRSMPEWYVTCFPTRTESKCNHMLLFIYIMVPRIRNKTGSYREDQLRVRRQIDFYDHATNYRILSKRLFFQNAMAGADTF